VDQVVLNIVLIKVLDIINGSKKNAKTNADLFYYIKDNLKFDQLI
jgi:hypothetical protein